MASNDDVLDLFEALSKSADAQVDAHAVLGPCGARAHLAELSAGFLKRVDALNSGPAKVRLNLFSSEQDGATYVADARMQAFTPFELSPVALLDAPVSQNGVRILSGRLDGENESVLTMTLVDGVMDLDLFVPSLAPMAHFQAMRFSPTSTYAIRQLDSELLPDCGVEKEEEAVDGSGADLSTMTNPVAKRLIVYTSRVRVALGGEASVRGARGISG